MVSTSGSSGMIFNKPLKLAADAPDHPHLRGIELDPGKKSADAHHPMFRILLVQKVHQLQHFRKVPVHTLQLERGGQRGFLQ